MGKISILSIGINRYPKLPDFFQLNYCENDAKIIHDKYSQFGSAYKKLLLNEDATQTEILKAIKDLSYNTRDDDYVIFNFAGHGFTTATESQDIKANNSFICPSDFENGYEDLTSISLESLKNFIDQIKSNSKLIIFDSCHSGGALRREFFDFNLREIKIDKFLEIIGKIQGTGIITACDSDESAIEDSTIKHGIFTHNLIMTLEEVDSEKHHALFAEVSAKVREKVRTATQNKQNPQAKGDNDLKILTLPKKSKQEKEIAVDNAIIPTLVPTAQAVKASEFYRQEDVEQIEKNIIQLIQENRFIQIDKLFKQIITNIFNKISKPEISLNAKRKEAIPYYESCREYLKPLILLNQYVLEYYDEKFVVENLEYIFKFESLIHGKSGLVAIIQIPLLLISEIILNILPIAYDKKRIQVLKKIYSHKITNSYGLTLPLIYDSSIWHPELFERDTNSLVNYLFPPEKIKQDFFSESRIKDLNEINFLFDCLSIKDGEHYGSYPTYLIFNDIDTLKRILSKLSNQEFTLFVENVFSIKIKEFLNIAVKRQNEISEWSDEFRDPFRRYSIKESKKKFEDLINSMP